MLRIEHDCETGLQCNFDCVKTSIFPNTVFVESGCSTEKCKNSENVSLDALFLILRNQ